MRNLLRILLCSILGLTLLSLSVEATGPYPNGYNSQVIGFLKSANFNSTADQPIPIAPGSAGQSYIIQGILCTNASAAPTLATGGVYTAASKGGTQVVSAAQTYTALSSTLIALQLTMANTSRRTEDPLYLSLSVAQGSAVTADCYVIGYPLP